MQYTGVFLNNIHSLGLTKNEDLILKYTF